MNDDELNKAANLSFGQYEDKQAAELFGLLCDEDAVTRHAAAMTLQRHGGRETLERGIALTRDERDYVRDNAAFLLGQLGYKDGYPFREETAPLLESMLNSDPSNEVRASAAAALGHLNAISARDSLVRALDDADAVVRYAAAFALSGMASPKVFPVIERIRNDPDGDFADWGEIAMELFYRKKYEAETVMNLCTVLADASLDIAARKSVAEILADRDEAIAWAQASVFRSSELAALRLNAPLLAKAIGRSEDSPPRPDVLGLLIDMLHDDADGGTRARTAEVLAEFKGAEVLDALITAADDPAWEVRHSVAFALSRHGGPEAAAGLARLCGDHDDCVARFAQERLDWMSHSLSRGEPSC